MLQLGRLGAYNNIAMELAMDSDKSHEHVCMPEKQFEEVLTFMGLVITNKTGKVQSCNVILRYSHAYEAQPNAKIQQRWILF